MLCNILQYRGLKFYPRKIKNMCNSGERQPHLTFAVENLRMQVKNPSLDSGIAVMIEIFDCEVSSGERLSHGPRLGTPALETSTPEHGAVF